MARAKILELLGGKWEDGTRPKDLFAFHVSKDPAGYVADILRGLASEDRKVQGGCAELASLLSEKEPKLLYPHMALFQANLDAKEPILRWEAVCTLGNLVAVDGRGLIRGSVDSIRGLLGHKSIVLQGHAVRALGKIAAAFPDLAPQVLDSLLAAKDEFPGNRVGYIVEAMAAFVGDDKLVPKIRRFVEPLSKSEIASVASKAQRVLKRLPTK